MDTFVGQRLHQIGTVHAGEMLTGPRNPPDITQKGRR